MRLTALVIVALAAPLAAAAPEVFSTSAPCQTTTPLGTTTLPACTVELTGQMNVGPCVATCKVSAHGHAIAKMPGDMDVALRFHPQTGPPVTLCVSGAIGATTDCYGSKVVDATVVPGACSAPMRLESYGTANVVVFASASVGYAVCQSPGGGAYYLQRTQD